MACPGLVCPVLHSRTRGMTTYFLRQRHRQARVRTVPARHGTPLSTRVAVYAAQRTCTQVGTATMQALLAISAPHRAAAPGEGSSPGAISLNTVYGSTDAPGGRPCTPEAGMRHSFAACAMHGVARLLRIGSSPARDPPMAHGQHHEPRQPMRRRQPHRGSRGQPSGTVAAARGRPCSCMQSSSQTSNYPQTCTRRVCNRGFH